MQVKVNVKRFSRSKVNDEQPTEEPIEPVIEKKRGRKKKVTIEEPIIEEPIIEEPIISETIEEVIPDNFDEIDDNFLSELNSSNYQREQEQEQNREANLKQQKEAEKERIKYLKEAEKERAKQDKINKQKINNDSELYSETAIEPQGKEKLLLLHKVKQYKNLFSNELKSYK